MCPIEKLQCIALKKSTGLCLIILPYFTNLFCFNKCSTETALDNLYLCHSVLTLFLFSLHNGNLFLNIEWICEKILFISLHLIRNWPYWIILHHSFAFGNVLFCSLALTRACFI